MLSKSVILALLPLLAFSSAQSASVVTLSASTGPFPGTAGTNASGIAMPTGGPYPAGNSTAATGASGVAGASGGTGAVGTRTSTMTAGGSTSTNTIGSGSGSGSGSSGSGSGSSGGSSSSSGNAAAATLMPIGIIGGAVAGAVALMI